MTTRSILQIFDQYQKARVAFVQTVADLAIRPQNVEILLDARVLGERAYRTLEHSKFVQQHFRPPQTADKWYVLANTAMRIDCHW